MDYKLHLTNGKTIYSLDRREIITLLKYVYTENKDEKVTYECLCISNKDWVKVDIVYCDEKMIRFSTSFNGRHVSVKCESKTSHYADNMIHYCLDYVEHTFRPEIVSGCVTFEEIPLQVATNEKLS